MSDEVEVAVVLCEPTTTPYEKVSPGSIETVCSDCNRGVWLSVEGQAFLVDNEAKVDHETKLVCSRCLVAFMKAHPEMPQQAREMPGALDAIREQFGDQYTEEIKKIMQMPLSELDMENWE